MLPLTTHLKTLNPKTYLSATTSPFLAAAGNGHLPKHALSLWLSQDRLYAQSYIRFIGLLLAKTHLPHTPSPQKTLQQKIVTTLIDALVNIQRELDFFEEVAGEYGLDLAVKGNGEGERFGPNPITQAYIDMFMSVGSAGVSLLEGLVVLWATEVCYLQAWEGARGVMEGTGGGKEGDLDGGALRERFIPNWTSAEFREFVEGIAEVVDALAGEIQDGEKGELVGRCERWWRQVKWLEERFWPDVPNQE